MRSLNYVIVDLIFYRFAYFLIGGILLSAFFLSNYSCRKRVIKWQDWKIIADFPLYSLKRPYIVLS